LNLPKDLKQAKKDIAESIETALNDSYSKRLSIFMKFEGLRINPIAIYLADHLNTKNINVFLVWADAGAVALAKRDYSKYNNNIYSFASFTKTDFVNDSNSVLISITPKPYEFEDFNSLTELYAGNHITINPKFEDSNIGIGQIVRDRRRNFTSTWKNVYYLEPLSKGSLMHLYPQNWYLYKEVNNRYSFVKEFDKRPSNEDIFVYL
tara:strand:+ start:19515 stop:20135 length:621 start_codon:yes stop_codon:yes gene_type:complete